MARRGTSAPSRRSLPICPRRPDRPRSAPSRGGPPLLPHLCRALRRASTRRRSSCSQRTTSPSSTVHARTRSSVSAWRRSPSSRRSGLRIGLGTDSPNSAPSFDMFDEMRAALALARATSRSVTALSPADALALATLGGAQALGLADEIGSLTRRQARRSHHRLARGDQLAALGRSGGRRVSSVAAPSACHVPSSMAFPATRKEVPNGTSFVEAQRSHAAECSVARTRAAGSAGGCRRRRARRATKRSSSSCGCAATRSGCSRFSPPRSSSASSFSVSALATGFSSMPFRASVERPRASSRSRTRRRRSTSIRTIPPPSSLWRNAHQAASRPEDAAGMLERYVKLRPDDSDALNQLAAIYEIEVAQATNRAGLLQSEALSGSLSSTISQFPTSSGFLGAATRDPIDNAITDSRQSRDRRRRTTRSRSYSSRRCPSGRRSSSSRPTRLCSTTSSGERRAAPGSRTRQSRPSRSSSSLRPMIRSRPAPRAHSSSLGSRPTPDCAVPETTTDSTTVTPDSATG